MLDRFINQVNTANKVIVIIEPPNKMRQSFCCICRQVIYVVKFMFCKKRGNKILICDTALYKHGTFRYMVFKTSAQVVQYNYFMTHSKAMFHDM